MFTNHPIINAICEGYLESNLWWAVNKTSNEKTKNLLYKKNMHILQLLLNVVMAGIEAFVTENKFSYDCAKEVCRLWALSRSDTFHQLLITVEAL
jgi:hypothetical protein